MWILVILYIRMGLKIRETSGVVRNYPRSTINNAPNATGQNQAIVPQDQPQQCPAHAAQNVTENSGDSVDNNIRGRRGCQNRKSTLFLKIFGKQNMMQLRKETP